MARKIEKKHLMATSVVMDDLVDILRDTILALVRRSGSDLTARQMTILLLTYTLREPQTVRGLATKLNVAKPPVTRALDRLEEFGLVRRRRDSLDRRNVLIERTVVGQEFLRELKFILGQAARRTLGPGALDAPTRDEI